MDASKYEFKVPPETFYEYGRAGPINLLPGMRFG